MTDAGRDRLARLTARWRERHDRRSSPEREPADPEREARAMTHFPFRAQSPAAYVDAHGADMIGFTYDDYVYADAELDAWIVELGRLLRMRRMER